MIHVYDLEASRWTKELSAAAITSNGKEYFFKGPGCFQKLARLMQKVKGKWAAHYGGGYDHLLMIPLLGEIKTAILTGSRLFSIKFVSGLELIDTFPSWLCGLAAVGKYVKRPKLNYDRTKLAALSEDELKEYNLNDCRILRDGWKTAEEFSSSVGMTHKMTAGSAAVEALRVLEPDTWTAFARNKISWQTLTTLENIAPGGFTDFMSVGPVSGIHCYDIKSSYPFRYSDPNGLGAGIEEYPIGQKTWDDPLTVVKVSWFLDIYNDDVTIAPAKDEETGLSAGHCSNWLSYDERLLLDSDPRVSRVVQHKAYGPKERLPDAGKEFLRILYEWKNDGVFFAKVWLNSLHGKFCEKVIKDTWDFHKPTETFLGLPPEQIDGVGLWRFEKLAVDSDGYAAPHFQPINGMLVYGRARAHIIGIIRKIQQAGFKVYYCDTDSVFTNCPPDIMRVLGIDCGDNLGQLSYEGGPLSGYILGRKLYYLSNEDKSIVKIAAKGVPMKRLTSATKKFGLYSEKSKGKDLQLQIFKQIWEKKSAKILRTGVTPFVVGSGPGKWERFRQIRTLRVCETSRWFDDDGVGHYMSAAV